MKLGRVAATVVSTISAPVFHGRRLLVCDLLAPDLSPAGGYVTGETLSVNGGMYMP